MSKNLLQQTEDLNARSKMKTITLVYAGKIRNLNKVLKIKDLNVESGRTTKTEVEGVNMNTKSN